MTLLRTVDGSSGEATTGELISNASGTATVSVSSGDVAITQNSQTVAMIDDTATRFCVRDFYVENALGTPRLTSAPFFTSITCPTVHFISNFANVLLAITDPVITMTTVFRYEGSTPANGYVLQCNASGDASWVDPATVNTATLELIQSSAGTASVNTTTDNIVSTQNSQTVATVDNTNHALTNRVVQVKPDGTNTRVSVDDVTTTVSNTLQYTGSTPSDGAMLMCDASGNASWMGDRQADCYWEANSTATPISVVGDFVKVSANSTTLGALVLGSWDLNGTVNRLRYTGTRGGLAHVGATLTIDGGNSQVYSAYIAKNGVKLPGSLVQMATSNATSIQSTAIHIMTAIAQNDYFELWMTNNTSTSSVTVIDANIFCLVHG